MSFAPVPQRTGGTAPRCIWLLRPAGPGPELRIEEGLRQQRLRGRRVVRQQYVVIHRLRFQIRHHVHGNTRAGDHGARDTRGARAAVNPRRVAAAVGLGSSGRWSTPPLNCRNRRTVRPSR